jgi:hypothetical protein
LSAAESFFGNNQRAAEVVDEGIRATALVDDPWGHMQLLTAIAVAQAGRDDYAAACASATEAVRLARELGNPTAQAIALGVFGWSVLRDDPQAAVAAFDESIALSRAGAGDATFPTSLLLVAPLRARVDDIEGALRATREGLAVARDLGDLPSVGMTPAVAVEVAFTAGEPGLAAVFSGMLDSPVLSALLFHNDPHLPERRRVLDRVREELGENEYAACRAQGAAMSFDEGIAYTLAEFDRMIREASRD